MEFSLRHLHLNKVIGKVLMTSNDANYNVYCNLLVYKFVNLSLIYSLMNGKDLYVYSCFLSRKLSSSSFGGRDSVKPAVPNHPTYKVLSRSGSAKETR